tara:strand:+ start:355 stop:750 length:396 start_codon:yes stop_codon:yes gene_type:complete
MAQAKTKARRKSPGRKISGGRYKREKKKPKHSLGHTPRIVKMGDTKQKTLKVQGGNEKTVLLKSNEINLTDKKTHKAVKAKITNVTETPSNRFLARQNVLTKGAIIETDKGKVRITNRPSQEGNVQGILVE